MVRQIRKERPVRSETLSRRALLQAFAAAAPAALTAAPAPPLAIEHVTVVDVGNGDLRPGQTVVIRGDRIASVGTNRVSGAHVIDGRGQFLIPGLWDMHVHLWTDPPLFGLYLKNGVTGIRDMGSQPARTRGWRQQISSGHRVGPRIITAGTPVDGPGPRIPQMPILTAETPEQARRAGDEWEKENVDFIKVLSGLSRDSYKALAAAARQMRWTLVGHLPEGITASEAVYGRQESIEHLFGMMLACSSEEYELRGTKADAKREQRIIATYDQKKAHDLFDLMRRYEAYQTPTLTMHQRMADLNVEAMLSEPQLALVPEAIRQAWDKPKPTASTTALAVYRRNQQFVKDMQAGGVRLLAGTDTGDDYVVPGASLHDELAQMVDAGLTPLAALQTATRNPAAFLHLEDKLGAVERGRFADLVLLEANPLADIRHTRRVTGVVMAGRYLSRAQLDSLARA